jgi:nucleotide-binding universal stress UspA family protein
MNDEWRLQVDPRDPSHAQALTERLEARELEHDLSNAFHDRVIVSRDDARVFLYAGSREQAESARELLLKLAQQHGWELDLELRHWHPTAEDWEDPDKPLPADDAAKQAEHQALIAAERKQTEERGYPEFEVRIDLASHHDALHLVERLRGDGLVPVHRWKYVLIGATDEDNAKVLAKQIEDEAPPGSKISVEGTWRAVYDERPPNPFAVLGGLGG